METTAAGQSRAMVLGSLTIPGRPEQVGSASSFVARALATSQAGADADAATLLTSEIVTNAIQHTRSGTEGGTVTIVVIGIWRGILVEIIDDGAAGAPVVKGDLYAAEGHGLFLVEHLASEWGYQRDEAGTTVWFHLPASYEPCASGGRPDRPPAEPARHQLTSPRTPCLGRAGQPSSGPQPLRPLPRPDRLAVSWPGSDLRLARA